MICVLRSVVIACFLLTIIGCDQSEEVQMNIEKLREASASLAKNPADKAALSLLLDQLHDRRGIYRVNAAAVLGETAQQVGGSISAKAVPALSELLDQGDEFDKRAAASALAKFGPHAKDAWPTLRKNLFPVDRDVAWHSADALGNIGEPAAAAVPDLMKALRENIGQCDGYFSNVCASFIPAIGKMRRSAASAEHELESMLNHKDPYVRMRLAIALIRINPGNSLALREMENLIRSSDVEVRRRTLVDLREAGKDAQPVKALLAPVLKDPDADVREAAESLSKILKN
jgi:HEAT repeat protein